MTLRTFFTLGSLALALSPSAGAAQSCPSDVASALASLARADTSATLCTLHNLDSAGSSDARVYLVQAAVLRSRGQLSAASVVLSRGIRRAPTDVSLRLDLGITEAMQGLFAPAMASFDTAETLAPGHASTAADRGWALAWARDTSGARSAFSLALKRDSLNVSAWDGLGFLAAARRDSLAASVMYARALQVAPADPQAIAFMNVWRVHRQNIPVWLIPGPRSSTGGVTSTPNGSPNDTAMAKALVRADKAMASGDRKAARGAVNRVLSLDSTSRVGRRDDGWLRLWDGDVSGAQARFSSLLAQDSTNLGSLLGLATAFRNTDDAMAARRLYLQVLRANPGNPDAIYGLAHTATSDHGEISAMGGYISVDDGRLGTSGAVDLTLRPASTLAIGLDAGREGVGDIHTTTNLVLLNGGATNYLGAGFLFRPHMGPVSIAVRDDHYSGGGEYVNAIDVQTAFDLSSRVSLIAGVRPDYSSFLAVGRLGLRAGVDLRVIPDGDVLLQSLHTTGVRLYGEPITTYSVSGGFVRARTQLRLDVAGSSDTGARFITPTASVLWYATEHWGVRVVAERRYGLFARKTIEAGPTARW